MIQSIDSFIGYFEGIRRRTLNYIRVLPPDRLSWSPRAGEFNCGELVQHLAAAERMFVGAVVDGRWHYAGHTYHPQHDYATLVANLESSHTAAMANLRRLPDEQLTAPRPTLDGPSTKAWRLLMALVEHEIHHRSQLALYLALMGVEP
ncbi:MAG TPA: DinB family protein, partial [Roseiflexaceae bacterium]|nr:DinB family protein [Roseiflexaceae bacterium]